MNLVANLKPNIVRRAIALCALPALLAGAQPRPILEYIRTTWTVLTRSNRDLARAVVDPKFPPAQNGRWPVYVSRGEGLRKIEEELRREMAPADFRKIILRILPAAGTSEPGLLYLPKPYVVPGGRFNEMYGWDSFFIQAGLVRDGQLALAKDMADNFLYEVRNYGQVLNANRTYYLTRSQPPFLSAMVLAVYRKTQDRNWLEQSVPALESFYQYWTTEPHLTSTTQLSRYFDRGDGPAPEVISDERDANGLTHYDRVREYFRTHRVTDYDVSQYYNAQADRLTNLFYKGDRSMRESGFDPSNRFGPFSVDVIRYNPVCLNSLLYLMETQMAEISGILGRGTEQESWRKRAASRSAAIDRLLWDERDGLYYDYNFAQGRLRHYPFLATFYPLWVGIASKAQAARIVANLPKFEQPGGLQTSTQVTGNQWDAPFGWAPLEMIAVQGLRRYGYQKEANRISSHFLSLIIEDFQKRGTIVEKYDVVQRTANVAANIRFGYSSNQAGFGWTNGVFTVLLDELPMDTQRELMRNSTPR